MLLTYGLLLACTSRVHIDTPPPEVDPSDEWSELLERASSSDGVDYALIAREREVLERYLAWNAVHGEVSDVMGEKRENARMASLINVYNAATIYGVLEYGPFDSVRDYRFGVHRVPGAAFFYGLRFKVDSDWMSLHHLEVVRILNRFQEPLAHVALNCASTSCPPVRWWTGSGFDKQLATAMRSYLSSEHGLRPDGEGYAVSQIFEWYADDFTDWSAAESVCAYLAPYAPDDAADWLSAHAEDCPLTYIPYDWSLNAWDSSSGGTGD